MPRRAMFKPGQLDLAYGVQPPRGFRLDGDRIDVATAHVTVDVEEWPAVGVLIDDPRLPFVITGTVDELGRVLAVGVDATAGRLHPPFDVVDRLDPSDPRRVPLVSLVREWAAVGRTAKERRDAGEQLPAIATKPQTLLAAVEAMARAVTPAPRRETERARGEDRRRLLLEVVRMYREELARGNPHPRKPIAKALGYSEAHVGRLLVEARKPEVGLLEPAPVGRAGEVRRRSRSR